MTSKELLDELAAAAGATDEQLSTIAALVALQVVREGEFSRLEALVKTAKTDLDDVRDKKLPEAMNAAKTKKFVDAMGRTVELKDEMTISLPKKRNDEIIAKLREWEFGDLVANTLTCILEKGQDNMAGHIMAEAEEVGLTMTRSESVAAGSVKKILMDKQKAGEDVDLTFFGAFQLKRAKITQ